MLLKNYAISQAIVYVCVWLEIQHLEESIHVYDELIVSGLLVYISCNIN